MAWIDISLVHAIRQFYDQILFLVFPMVTLFPFVIAGPLKSSGSFLATE
jgi:hypothetical protein